MREQGCIQFECDKSLVDSQNQLLIERLARQTVKLQRLGATTMASKLVKVFRDRKQGNFKFLIELLNQHKGKAKVCDVIKRIEGRIRSRNCFSKWKDYFMSLRKVSENIEAGAYTLIKRAYYQRVRQAFSKWAKVALKETEYQKLRKIVLMRVTKYFENSQVTQKK